MINENLKTKTRKYNIKGRVFVRIKKTGCPKQINLFDMLLIQNNDNKK